MWRSGGIYSAKDSEVMGMDENRIGGRDCRFGKFWEYGGYQRRRNGDLS